MSALCDCPQRATTMTAGIQLTEETFAPAHPAADYEGQRGRSEIIIHQVHYYAS